MLHETPYTTTILKAVPHNYAHELKKIFQLGYYIRITKDLYGIIRDDMDIPPFIQPFSYVDNGKRFTFIDIRGAKIDPYMSHGEYYKTSELKYKATILRGKLQSAWFNSFNKDQFENLIPYAHEIYGMWISSVLSKRFGLDQGQQFMIRAIAAIYFYGLFYKEFNHWQDPNTREMARLKLKGLKLSDMYTDHVVEAIPTQMNTLEDLVENIKKITGSVKLERLTSGVLISLIASSWSQNEELTLALSLEHPPTFLSLILIAVEEAFYRKTGFAQIVEDVVKRNRDNKGNISFRINQIIESS